MLHSDRASFAPTNPVLVALRAPSPLKAQVHAQAQAGALRMPKVIHDALGLYCSRLGDCAMFRDASVGARAVMAEFIRCIDKVDPAAPIRIGDSTLAAALDASVRSVQRWKRELEELGWIQRRQYLTRKRPFDLSHVRIGQAALRALGLCPTGSRALSRATSRGASRAVGASAPSIEASAEQGRRRAGASSSVVDNLAESYPQSQPFLADALDTIPQLSLKGQYALRAAACNDPLNAAMPAASLAPTPRLHAHQQGQETPAFEGSCKRLSASEERDLHKLQAVYGDGLDAMPDPLSLEVDSERGGLVTLPPAALPMAESVESAKPTAATDRAAGCQPTDEVSARVGLSTSPAAGSAGALPSDAATLPMPESLPVYLADLAPLRELGIAVSGIFKLMRMASDAGHRLGDIVAARIADIRGADVPFAYVRELLRGQRNWAAAARTQQHATGDDYSRASSSTSSAPSRAWQAENRRIAAVVAGVPSGVVYSHETAPYVWHRVGSVILQASRDQVVGRSGCELNRSLSDPCWLPVNQPASFVRDWEGGKIHAVEGAAGAAPVKPDSPSEQTKPPRDGRALIATLTVALGAQE